ncbi:hypothetical protein [Mesorhizobium sp. B2-4-17]|uniref:hypothetical protein n=1 Tax=Mesorhizobium sp. B2-4-17 TaxID=2589932 RepID=UPI0011271FB5|nr:hypothetical protein [Mesorhizobium sp. B2-4-17]TPK78215.1 hypothetical protein FJ548_25110 [Mesorhizobium sp. B2-4-17]
MVKSVNEEPHVVLTRWGIMQQNHIGFRLVGVHAATGIPRITSPVIAFEEFGMTATTESGRTYRLEGPADQDATVQAIHAHIRRWGLTVHDVALADVSDLAPALPRNPQGSWH